jgi:uncharacterized protein
VASFRNEWTETFQPPLLLRSGHLQTLRAALMRAEHWPYQARQHVLETSDGDRLVLHDDNPEGNIQEGTHQLSQCALLVHGLGGSHLSPYMVRISHKLREMGVRTFRLDMRGCGAGWDLARRPGHAGRSEDVEVAARYIRSQLPSHRLTLVGFSLGGNIVLKLLGELGDRAAALVDRAMAVAPPVDLSECARNLQRPGMFLYNRWFVRSLMDAARRRALFDPEVEARLRGSAPRTLYEFDDRVTAPLSGFSGADEYYAKCSAAPGLGRIAVPSLILSAADDPLIPPAIFRRLTFSRPVFLQITRYGGHVGFFSRPEAEEDEFWLDRRVMEVVTGLEIPSLGEPLVMCSEPLEEGALEMGGDFSV